ncbi:MAG: hypothetical protein EZS28_032631 [Streblomastix strix]|uniref:Uncharacterized protein n=1 Tax=Streblomastix strix TaxID=222440 RepID=A0A5J4UNV2_9EUKA|nr:MAG: hypothetical protein EZS28_032631 [Streblomastix strix]
MTPNFQINLYEIGDVKLVYQDIYNRSQAGSAEPFVFERSPYLLQVLKSGLRFDLFVQSAVLARGYDYDLNVQLAVYERVVGFVCGALNLVFYQETVWGDKNQGDYQFSSGELSDLF